MALSLMIQGMLGVCAKAIIDNDETALDMYELRRERGAFEDALPVLRREVERLSNQTRTIREGDVALFAHKPLGPCLFLVACPFDTPPGEVTELTGDMSLVRLGPYSHGLHVNDEPASPEAVAEHRAFIAKGKADQAELEEAAAAVTAFLADLTDTARMWLRLRNDLRAQERQEILQQLGTSGPASLEAIARACTKMGLNLRHLATQTRPML